MKLVWLNSTESIYFSRISFSCVSICIEVITERHFDDQFPSDGTGKPQTAVQHSKPLRCVGKELKKQAHHSQFSTPAFCEVSI